MSSKAIWRTAAPAVLAVAWGGNHFSPLLLLYRQVDGYSTVQVNLFFGFYVLGLIPGLLLTAPVADRFGRRPTVAAALVLGVAGSVMLAFLSGSAAGMCAGRLVSGVGVAAAMVAGTSWIKELSEHDADPPARARRASLTLTAGFGLGAGVSGVLAQWGPAPTLLPYAVQVALSVAATIPLARTPETLRGIPMRLDLRFPPGGGRRFTRIVLPMAPWVFGAPALAFVVGPALVAERTGDLRIAFATLLAVITLVTGAGIQPFVPRLARPGVAGLFVFALATGLLAVDAVVLSPLLGAVAAALFGIAYGVCIVAGLVEVQAMATPETLAGLTGVYWSLTYAGFFLPLILASLAGLAGYPVLLAAVAVAVIGCAATLRKVHA